MAISAVSDLRARGPFGADLNPRLRLQLKIFTPLLVLRRSCGSGVGANFCQQLGKSTDSPSTQTNAPKQQQK